VVAILFLPLFVFLPKLIQRTMKAEAAIDAFGKNEKVRKVIWTRFVRNSFSSFYEDFKKIIP